MNTYSPKWRLAIPGKLSNSNQIHVWRGNINLTKLQVEGMLKILSKDELERAGRFRFERDQKRFIAARGLLRQILSFYIEKSPHTFQFEYNNYGKPILVTDSGCDTLSFNLSHSGTIALYAFTYDRKIGIDIERIRDDVAIEQIAQSFFSPSEIGSLMKINKNMLTEVIFQYWTRKEAFLKAIGEGISFPMKQFDVSLVSGRALTPITLLSDNLESSVWYGQDLFPGCGYAAAIAVEGSDLDLSCWHYSL